MVKLMVGLFAVTIIALSSGFAAAHNQNHPTDLTGYNKEQCKDGGWEALGFKNQGECVSYFASGQANQQAEADTDTDTDTGTSNDNSLNTTVNASDKAETHVTIVQTIINAANSITLHLGLN